MILALYDNQIPQKDVKNVRPRKENKELDKTSDGKDLILFNFFA